MAWEIDFQLSFGDPSIGRDEQRIVNLSGQPILSSWVWKSVDEAITFLNRALPPDSSKHPAIAVRDAFPQISSYILDALQEGFFPMLLEADKAGVLDIHGEPHGGSIQMHWKKNGLIERSRLFLQSIEQIPLAFSDSKVLGELVQLIAAACVISRANSAAISVFFDGSGLDDTAADVQWFSRYMELPSSMVKLVDVVRVQARKTVTADATRKRSEPAQKRIDQIRAIWASGKYQSREQCAKSEFKNLGFRTFSTARNALDGTPQPEKM